jgi:tRNA A37 threonylcarbamoyladenosine synthetase subunit TsaC/SUA5/YrdC
MGGDRDLAEAIYAELRTDEALDHAVERWNAHLLLPLRTQLGLVLDAVTASALDRVLARRQREAARTGPWEAP